jgi:hypothetical protein
LTPENVNKTLFGMLFKRVLDDQLYTQPLIATNVQVNGGMHDVVYVTTVNNSVCAFDANDANASSPFWHVNFGTPANLHCADFGCLDINGQMGIIGTPVIDKARGVLYVVSLTHSKSTAAPHSGFIQRLHALNLATGADLPASPVEIKAPGFNALMQNQRPALALAHGMVYVGYASHCDKDPYHGCLMAYDAQTLEQVGVLNTSPTGSEASIWQSGQGPAVDEQGNIYAVTGNGSWDGVKNFSESLLKLSPKLRLLDWFTPTNHFALDKLDNDLNSSGATLIPGKQLVLGGGKEGVLYTLDTSNLGHLGDQHAIQHFKATASHLHSLVYWKSASGGDLLYVWGQRDRARVYSLEGKRIGETPVMIRDEPNEGHPVPCYPSRQTAIRMESFGRQFTPRETPGMNRAPAFFMPMMQPISGVSFGTRSKSQPVTIAENTPRWRRRALQTERSTSRVLVRRTQVPANSASMDYCPELWCRIAGTHRSESRNLREYRNA